MKVNARILGIAMAAVLCTVAFRAATAADGFSSVPAISTARLLERRGEVRLIDVRSPFEFEALTIQDAINVPRAAPGFGKRLKALAEAHRPLVLFGNDTRSQEAAKAVAQAVRMGIGPVFLYREGVFGLAETHPELVVRRGGPLPNGWLVANRAWFQEHALDVSTFLKQARAEHAMVIDVRDSGQRGGVLLFNGLECTAPLLRLDRLTRCLQRAQKAGQPVYLYGETDAQTRLLRDVLEQAGLKGYRFLQGGAHAYYARLIEDNGALRARRPVERVRQVVSLETVDVP